MKKFKVPIASMLCSVVLFGSMAVGADAATYNVGWAGSFNQTNNNQTTSAPLPTDAAAVQKAWAAPVGNSTVVILDDYVYTYNGTNLGAGTKGTLYKIDKKSGVIVKSVEDDGNCELYYSYICYGDGRLYVCCKGSLAAFDPDTLQRLWKSETNDAKQYVPVQYVNGFVVTNGQVFNAATGASVKTLPGQYNYSNGAYWASKKMFYLPSADGKIYAFDATTWEKKGEYQFSSKIATKQGGVALQGNRLFWAAGEEGKLCSLEVSYSDGTFVTGSLKTADCGIYGPCVPVVANGKVYYAGADKNDVGKIGVYTATDLQQEAVYSVTGKVQSTPIVRIVQSSGGEIASVSEVAELATATVSAGNYVYFQDYENPSKIYVLKDVTEGTDKLEALVTIDPANYAYEQIACDKDGALYVTNDSQYLIKYTDKGETLVVKLGDINGDGEIDAKDITVLKRSLANWQNISLNAANADMNKDSVLDSKDITCLKRVLAGWGDNAN